jgi:hypothetical protein
MKKCIKPSQGYAVIHPLVGVMTWTVSPHRYQSVNKATFNLEQEWSKLYRRGFRCIRVTITPAPAKKGKK